MSSSKVHLPPPQGLTQHPTYDFLWISEDGDVWSSRTGKYHKVNPLHNNTMGYPRIRIRIDDRRVKLFIHRLVAETFLPNPQRLSEVNHIDGDKQNYSLSNLEWTDRVGNMRHAKETLGWIPFK